MVKANVLDTLNNIDNLPTLPIVAQQILKLIASPNSNMEQIANVITKDQAITAKVIKLTNSAFYGLRNRISSIKHAIVILGLNTIKNLVLGVSVVKTFEDNARTSIFDREQFWLHAFSTALGARLIAGYLGKENIEDYFLAGLLHDIGILAIDQFLHDAFIEILNRSLEEPDFIKLEQDVLGMHHGDVGAFLGEKWKLPAFLISTMQYHHSPSMVPSEVGEEKGKIAIVHIADVKSREIGLCKFIYNFHPTYDPTIYKRISPPESKLTEIGRQVQQETNILIKEWGF